MECLKRLNLIWPPSLPIFLTVLALIAPLQSARASSDDEVIQWVKETRRQARAAGICEDYVTGSPHYAETQTFEGPNEPAEFTLKPEPGSLENKYPGLVARLVDIRRRLIRERDHLPPPNTWTEQLADGLTENVIKAVNDVCRDIDDPRMCLLQDQFAKYLRTQIAVTQTKDQYVDLKAQITRISAGLWELIMACFFEGEEIQLNQKAADLYPAEFKALNLPGREKFRFNREIDIAIRNKDGSWRWIEVKAWSQGMNSDPRLADKAIDQSWALDGLRKKLNLKIETVLLMKHGMAGIVFLHYKLSSKFDQIIFAFPTGN